MILRPPAWYDSGVNTAPLLRITPAGLFCEAGQFFIDPWQPVSRAVITHAHGDHARRGSPLYLTCRDGERVLRARMLPQARIDTLAYGEELLLHGVKVSFHPAGHILGSAQVRIEHRGEVWVVSGDYKVTPDPTCAPFEPLRCHTFVTESTFGLPVFRWPSQTSVFDQINAWWRENQAAGRASLLYGYALGKAQRLLAGVDAGIGPISTHGAVETVNVHYRESGIALPRTTVATQAQAPAKWSDALIVAPPSAHGTPWMRKFGEVSTAFASGWMCLRGARRRRTVDRGFVLSDHADWPELLGAVRATGAERILVTHGYIGAMVRWLQEQGLQAEALATRFEGEQDDAPALDPEDVDYGSLAPAADSAEPDAINST